MLTGISQNDFLTVFISIVRPVVEYIFPVWHTNLPNYLSDDIEIRDDTETSTKIYISW